MSLIAELTRTQKLNAGLETYIHVYYKVKLYTTDFIFSVRITMIPVYVNISGNIFYSRIAYFFKLCTCITPYSFGNVNIDIERRQRLRTYSLIHP